MNRFFCPICYNHFGDYDEFVTNYHSCQTKQREFKYKMNYVDEIIRQIREQEEILKVIESENKLKQMKQIVPLTPCQTKANDFTIKKARIMHQSTYLNAVKLFMDLGYDENALKKVLTYMLTVPVTINFPTKLLGIFLKEDHYKNGFELNRFGEHGEHSARGMWETTLYHGIYDKCEPRERVKYGSINLYNEKGGCKQSSGYGKSFFILKQDVKQRMSITPTDSCAQDLVLATFSHCAQLLLHLKGQRLDDLIKYVVTGVSKGSYSYGYVEVQIHGDVLFDRDIDTLVLCKTEKHEKLGEQFCRKYGCKLC